MIPEQQMQEFAQRMQMLQQQLELLQHQLNELEQVKEGILAINKVEREQETLISLGAGVFARGIVTDKETVLMNIGSNIVVEKDIKSAEETVGKQIAQLQEIGNNMRMELENVSQLVQMMQQSVQTPEK